MAYKEYRNLKVYEQGGYRHEPPIEVKCEGGRLTITRADEVISG